MARRGTNVAEAKYVRCVYRVRGIFDSREIYIEGAAGDRRRERGRDVDGRGRESASGFVPGGDCAGAVCGCVEHDAGRDAAVDDERIYRVGKSEREGGV